MSRYLFRWLLTIGTLFTMTASAWSGEAGASRFSPPEFESGYKLPTMTQPPPRPDWREMLDVAALLLALSLAAWFLLGWRSRRAMAVLSIASLAYFGFYREGCICPIGAIQNVSLALANQNYLVPVSVVLFFALPLLFTVLFGRVFCGGVCPLGAIQDVVLIRPIRVPSWLQHALGLVPFLYLGLAVVLSATETMFIICRYDPFVSFFRLSGSFCMLIVGGVTLVLSMFIGRPYCRFLCPYGAMLSLFSRFAWRRPSITPDECVACSLCRDACPFGAIRPPIPETALEEQ